MKDKTLDEYIFCYRCDQPRKTALEYDDYGVPSFYCSACGGNDVVGMTELSKHLWNKIERIRRI